MCKINCCTIFAKNYLSRGLALYNSISQYPNVVLYVLAIDDETASALEKLHYRNLNVVRLAEIENNDLIHAKQNRSLGEYCWTLKGFLLEYIMLKYKLTNCIYLDADLYFYQTPELLLQQMEEKSVLITPHNYAEKHKHYEDKAGRYCAQLLVFKNTKEAMGLLNSWKLKCLRWCYSRFENGMFGDQGYLNEWPEKYKFVHVLEHQGCGLAPWNAEEYKLVQESNSLKVINLSSNNVYDIVFYHFHDLKFYKYYIQLFSSGYEVPEDFKNLVYLPYTSVLQDIEKRLSHCSFDIHGTIISDYEKNNKLREIIKENLVKSGLIKPKLTGKHMVQR